MQTNKVTLRPWCVEDAAFLTKLRNHPDLKKWFRQERDLTVEEEKAFIASNWDYKGFVILRSDGIRVGYIALVFHGDDNKAAEFSIALHPRYHGKGYAKEALNTLCHFAYSMFGVERIYSDVFSHNPALGMYVEKCGFTLLCKKSNYCFKNGQGVVDAVGIERWVKPY